MNNALAHDAKLGKWGWASKPSRLTTPYPSNLILISSRGGPWMTAPDRDQLVAMPLQHSNNNCVVVCWRTRVAPLHEESFEACGADWHRDLLAGSHPVLVERLDVSLTQRHRAMLLKLKRRPDQLGGTVGAGRG